MLEELEKKLELVKEENTKLKKNLVNNFSILLNTFRDLQTKIEEIEKLNVYPEEELKFIKYKFKEAQEMVLDKLIK